MSKTIVLFHANWCGACQSFMPDWEALKTEFKADPDITLIGVEESKQEKEGDTITVGGLEIPSNMINGYPTLLKIEGKGAPVSFDTAKKPRTIVNVRNWITGQTGFKGQTGGKGKPTKKASPRKRTRGTKRNREMSTPTPSPVKKATKRKRRKTGGFKSNRNWMEQFLQWFK